MYTDYPQTLEESIPPQYRLTYREMRGIETVRIDTIGDIEGFIYDESKQGKSKSLIEAKLKIKRGSINKNLEYMIAYEEGRRAYLHLIRESITPILFDEKHLVSRVQAQKNGMDLIRLEEEFRAETEQEDFEYDDGDDIELESMLEDIQGY